MDERSQLLCPCIKQTTIQEGHALPVLEMVDEYFMELDAKISLNARSF